MKRTLTPLLLILSLAALATPGLANSIDDAGLVMGCFIDTSSFDTYRANDCYLAGSSDSTASFKVLNISDSSRYTIDWQVGGCTNPNFCTVPISPGQDITVSARVTDNQTEDTKTLAATAHYIFEPGF